VSQYSSLVFNNSFSNSHSNSNSGSLLSFLYQQYCDNLETSKFLVQLLERYDFNDNKTFNEDLSTQSTQSTQSIESICQRISNFFSTIYQSILKIYSFIISKTEHNEGKKSFFNIIKELHNFRTCVVETIEQHQININILNISNISDLTVYQIFKQFVSLYTQLYQQYSIIFQPIINFLTTIGYSIPIHNFQEFNIKIFSLSINDFSNFNSVIHSIQNIFD
jgi:hypothetical protein